MADKTVADLPEAVEPLLSSDYVLISRDEVNVTKTTLDKINKVGIPPEGFTSRSLTGVDFGKVLIPIDGVQEFTIPTGLPIGFYCSFNNDGEVTAGLGVTVTDKRTAGSTNPIGAIINISEDVYEVWGSRG